jgi:hypothetical protein
MTSECERLGLSPEKLIVTIISGVLSFGMSIVVIVSALKLVAPAYWGIFLAAALVSISIFLHNVLYYSVRSTRDSDLSHIPVETKVLIAMSNSRVDDIHSPQIDEIKNRLFRMGYITNPTSNNLTQAGERKVLEYKRLLTRRNLVFLSMSIAAFSLAVSLLNQSRLVTSILLLTAVVTINVSYSTRRYIEW